MVRNLYKLNIDRNYILNDRKGVKPRAYTQISKNANIVEKYENNGWIINKGFTSGFDVGKFVIPIGDKRGKFRIIESSPKYSLIAPFPKRDIELKPGEKLKLFGNQISNSGMPKILVMPVEFCYSTLFDKNIKSFTSYKEFD